MKIPRVGLCGFTMSMEDYSLYFPVVEIQQTFYQPPRDETLRRWLVSTPRSLEFTMKAWQLVTHPSTSPTFRRTKRPLSPSEREGCGFFQRTPIVDEGYRRSIDCARTLGATAMLFQCPSSFAPDEANVRRMRAFFGPSGSPRPAGLRYLWEPRGSKWVVARDQARALSDELGLVHVIDPFVTPPGPGRRIPVYWRLHGIGGARHSYSDEELLRLRAMVEEAHDPALPEPPYVLFNNLPRVRDARRFLALLDAPSERPARGRDPGLIGSPARTG